MRHAAPPHPPLFREVQRFTHPWIWILIVPLACLLWLAALQRLILGEAAAREAASSPSWVLLLAWLLCGVGFPWLFAVMRLMTEVREDGIYIRFIPFHRRYQRFAFGDVAHVEDRIYRPILEYGGWGIRYGLEGKAYNVSGNRGVQLVFKNGKRLLIGSQRAVELSQTIQLAMGDQGVKG